MSEQNIEQSAQHEQQRPAGLAVRFFKAASANPKAPVASYRVELDGTLTGLCLRGVVWAEEGRGSISYRIDLPGKARFGDPSISVVRTHAGYFSARSAAHSSRANTR